MTAMIPALQAYIEKEFGGRFDYSLKSVTVGTSVTKVVDHNFERMALAIIQLGSGSLYLSPLRTVSSSEGIALVAAGGSATFTARNDLVLPGVEWWGVGSAAGQTVFVLEVFRYQTADNAGG